MMHIERATAAGKTRSRFYTLALCLFLALPLALAGCAGTLPGGTESANRKYYDGDKDLKIWMEELQPGMTMPEVMARLGRTRNDFTRLTRAEVISVLFGGRDSGIPDIFKTDEDIQLFLESLDGYRFDYKMIKRKHGFTSPIRIQTDSSGFNYSVNIVFRNGKLYQKPILSGGKVESSNTKTIFDYLNLGMAFNAVN